MAKRVYVVKEIDKRLRRSSELVTPIAIGGGTVLATERHALDGPEHTEATETNQKLATAGHSGLLLPLSGDIDDALRGDGTWGALGDFVTVDDGGKETVSTVAASGATEALDLGAGNVHDLTLTADCTITLTGATAGVACSMLILLRQDGTGGWLVTWPGSVSWPDATPPVLATDPNAVDVVSLVTLDGGTTWYGAYQGAGVVDHGTLTGLTDDDHTQYLKETDVAAKGDLYAASANDTVGVLTAGSNGQVLTVDLTQSLGVKWATPAASANAVGPILIADTPAGSPLVFADLLQNEAGADLLYEEP